EPLKAAPQHDVAVAFEKQMHVIALDAEVQNAESVMGGLCERRPRRAEHVITTQRRQTGAHTQRRMHGTPRVVSGPAAMRNTSPVRRRLASGTGASPTPRTLQQLQLSRCPLHLERAHITAS